MRPLTWLFAAVGVACAAPTPTHMPDARLQFPIPLGLDRYRPVPEHNPLTPGKIALGRALFFDSLLSKDRSLACATCHDPARAFTDGRPMSIGVFDRQGRRNVPTLVNRAYGKSFFWDGRMSTLEEQVLEPIQDSLEMGVTLDEVVRRLNEDPQAIRRHSHLASRFRVNLSHCPLAIIVQHDGKSRNLACNNLLRDYLQTLDCLETCYRGANVFRPNIE